MYPLQVCTFQPSNFTSLAMKGLKGQHSKFGSEGVKGSTFKAAKTDMDAIPSAEHSLWP